MHINKQAQNDEPNEREMKAQTRGMSKTPNPSHAEMWPLLAWK